MVSEHLQSILATLPREVTLVAVSKFHPARVIQEAYDAGQRDFGESRAQELTAKVPLLPGDIRWHFIGPLQKNKVKYLVPFVWLIHSVDSRDLFLEIVKQAGKVNRQQRCLLEIKVAQEETKSGWEPAQAESFLAEYAANPLWQSLVSIQGIMGIATQTQDTEQIRREFASLHGLLEGWRNKFPELGLKTLSMGMSGDWPLAVEEGANMVRIGSAIFGSRGY